MVSATTIIDYSILATAFIIGVTVHEYAHAQVALWLGDHTAEHAGRVTINPLKHLDPLGLFFIIAAGFGWAKPVPFNEYNFKNKITGTLCVAFAGPVTNIIIACIALMAFKSLLIINFLSPLIAKILITLARINVMLGVFNLLPLPPLDGAHLYRLFGRDLYIKIMGELSQWALLILFVLLSVPALSRTLQMVINRAYSLLFFMIVGA